MQQRVPEKYSQLRCHIAIDAPETMQCPFAKVSKTMSVVLRGGCGGRQIKLASLLDFYKFNSASYDKVLLKFSRSRMSNCQLAVTRFRWHTHSPSLSFSAIPSMIWPSSGWAEPFLIRCLALEDLPSRFHVWIFANAFAFHAQLQKRREKE